MLQRNTVRHGIALVVVVMSMSAFDSGTLAQGGSAAAAPETVIKRLDRDGDGKVSRDEFRGPPDRFTRIDTNHDGFLTLEEFRAARERRTRTIKSRNGGRRGGAARGWSLYFVDAHSQMDDKIDERTIISLMDRTGIYRTILAKHRDRPWESVIRFAEAYPNRIVPSIFTKAMHKNAEEIEAQEASGKFRAMEEILLWHDKVKQDFDDPAVERAIAFAIGRGWPVVLHLEFNKMSGSQRAHYMKKSSRRWPRSIRLPRLS